MYMDSHIYIINYYISEKIEDERKVNMLCNTYRNTNEDSESIILEIIKLGNEITLSALHEHWLGN